MTSPLFALGAAASFSLSQVFIRLGSRNIAPLAGLVLSLASGFVVLAIALLVRGVVRPNLAAVAVFALAGLMGPGLGRNLLITSISRIGASRTAPVVSAAQPIVAVGLGVLVLAETVRLSRAVGIVVTLTGVLLVVTAGQRAASRPSLGADGAPIPIVSQGLRVLLWPLGAGAAFALADLVRKAGMQLMDDVLLGGSIGMVVALAIWGTALIMRGEGPAFLQGMRTRDAKWFLASGVAAGVAQVSILSALLDGDLSVVGPIVSTQPILTAIFTRLLISRVEKVTITVGIAAALATVGTILIAR